MKGPSEKKKKRKNGNSGGKTSLGIIGDDFSASEICPSVCPSMPSWRGMLCSEDSLLEYFQGELVEARRVLVRERAE